MEPTSPADESTSKRVQVIVDGVELSTHAPPEEELITDEDIMRRFNQTDQAVNHMNFMFMGNQDYVISYVNQARRERELHGKQLAEVTAQRDAASVTGGPAEEQVKEANRERDTAQAAEINAQANMVEQVKEVHQLNEELNGLSASSPRWSR